MLVEIGTAHDFANPSNSTSRVTRLGSADTSGDAIMLLGSLVLVGLSSGYHRCRGG